MCEDSTTTVAEECTPSSETTILKLPRCLGKSTVLCLEPYLCQNILEPGKLPDKCLHFHSLCTSIAASTRIRLLEPLALKHKKQKYDFSFGNYIKFINMLTAEQTCFSRWLLDCNILGECIEVEVSSCLFMPVG